MSEGDEIETDVLYPEWTDYSKKNGLDPLGMQNTSVSLYQTFLPGISNVTLRMRYYGLYAWLANHYAKQIGDTDPESWKRIVRRTEALYALIAQRKGGETGVAGTEWAQRTLDETTKDPIDFATAAEPGSETFYLKQAWGAFGAAYRSQLFEIGIFVASNDHEIPLLSQESGVRLAAVFEEALGELSAQFFEIIQSGRVTREELDQLAAVVPSAISFEGQERVLYQEILLSGGQPLDVASESRRLTLLLVLRITELLGRDPKPEEIRWILYSGFDQDGSPLDLDSSDLMSQRERWWVYQANDLCHIALEAILKFALDTLATFPSGITMERLLPICAERMLSAVEPAPETWEAFLSSQNLAENAYNAEVAESDWNLSGAVLRGAGRSDASVCSAETAWKALTLLAVLHKRVQEDGHEVGSELGVFDPESFRSLLSETRFLERQMEVPLTETVARLIEERVLRRHLWIALKKLRYQGDYTFLVETDEGRIRLREKDGPVQTNPRLGPAINFLKDIHLISDEGLTSHGRRAVRGT